MPSHGLSTGSRASRARSVCRALAASFSVRLMRKSRWALSLSRGCRLSLRTPVVAHWRCRSARSLQLVTPPLVDLVGLVGVPAGVGPLGLVAAPPSAVLAAGPVVDVELENAGHRPRQEVPVVGDDRPSRPAGSAPRSPVAAGLRSRDRWSARPAGSGRSGTARWRPGPPWPAVLRRGSTPPGRTARGRARGRRAAASIRASKSATPRPANRSRAASYRRSAAGPPADRAAAAAANSSSAWRLPVRRDSQLAHRLPGHPVMLLGQVAHRGRLRVPDDLTGVGLDQAGQQLEQGGLPHPVGPHDTDTALRTDRDRDVGEDQPTAPVVGDVARHHRGRRTERVAWDGMERCAGNGEPLGPWTESDAGSPVLSARWRS